MAVKMKTDSVVRFVVIITSFLVKKTVLIVSKHFIFAVNISVQPVKKVFLQQSSRFPFQGRWCLSEESRNK